MKNKMNIVFYTVIILFVIPSLSLAYFITINTLQKKVGAVYFDHNYHLDKENGLGFACNECHHELKTPDQSPSKCSLCHFPKELTESIKKEFPLDLKETYHTKCRGCHQKNKKKYKDAPTSDCGVCHKKDFEKFLQERSLKEQEKIKIIIEKTQK
ncbi:MAG: cytochrome c3 family protein [Candidatus Firestonebacteria bacterium]|nr:cytochrome c3 family protein [Candidatus Firestonebacteria bacterium]